MADYSEIKELALRVRNNTSPASNTATLVGGLLVSIVTLLEQLEERGGSGGGGGISPGDFFNLFVQNIQPYLEEIENGTVIAGKAVKLANPIGLSVVDYENAHSGPSIPVDGSVASALPMPDKINALELILRNGLNNGIVSLDEQGRFIFSNAIICHEDVVSYGAGTGDIQTVAQIIQSTIEQMKQDGQLSSGAGITSVALDYDATLYKFRVHIIDGNNSDFFSDYVDLPIETVVVNGRFDEETKKLILTLTNGSTIDISVGQIIAGLASETYVGNAISTEVTNRNSAIESAISTEVTNRNSAISSNISNIKNGVRNLTTVQNATVSASTSNVLVASLTSYAKSIANGTPITISFDYTHNITDGRVRLRSYVQTDYPIIRDFSSSTASSGHIKITFNAGSMSARTVAMYAEGSSRTGTLTLSNIMITEGNVDTAFAPAFENYVSLAGTETITGQKTFEQSAWNNGIKIKSTVNDSGASIRVSALNKELGGFGINGSGKFQVETYKGGTTLATTMDMDRDGNVVFAGEVSAYSDRRLKSDIQTLQNRGFLHPVSYIKDGKKQIGFVAQEVRDLYPETVLGEETENEFLSLNYGALTAALQAQILDQQKQIDELRRIVKILLEE